MAAEAEGGQDRHQDALRPRAGPGAAAAQTLRLTTAGRSACSARQLVASIIGSIKNQNQLIACLRI